ncbi:beta-N-acetylhexosaminidase [Motiliproteus sp. SC1-56]|uniref:beta-N-acetylhexosaminidase n=1 Tax=Motiliproteus sp. SC1-56 TaxID=2799565 RepID=UPI001A8DBF8C|nr:beta-N-acetylhexosaminidase [Motiliproteus sp. SC1-56]
MTAAGPLMLDLEGTALTAEECEVLKAPPVGGVILFSRNYQSPEQLQALTGEIRRLRPELLIAVDQEGGRVQRFREGLTRFPAMGRLAALCLEVPGEALALAEECGWLLAAELLALGVDISFAPVLDLDRGISEVIGDRALGARPETVMALAGALMKGMQAAGMATTGKHFPGHGGVAADSHHEMPVDPRPYEAIEAEDLRPFARFARQGMAGVMPAHVVYPACDPQPAGFSPFWLQQILRQRLGFEGVIFSDDLSMAGAEGVGGYPARAEAALAAGCDMVLVCNQPQAAREVLAWLQENGSGPAERVPRMKGRPGMDWMALIGSERRRQIQQRLEELEH